MRKNKMMRTASGLLVATLLTSSVLFGTFAKYTTSDSGSDSARVAKWGVTVTATEADAFAKEYDSNTEGVTAKTVISLDDKKVVAPGTKGTLLTYKITGKPEVVVNIKATADLKLQNWTTNENSTYCPIIFKIKRGTGNEVTYKLGSSKDESNHIYDTTAGLETAIESAITEMSENNTNANTDLADSITVTWEWPFADTTVGAYQTDVKDTALGDLTTAPTISMESSVTIEQVD